MRHLKRISPSLVLVVAAFSIITIPVLTVTASPVNCAGGTVVSSRICEIRFLRDGTFTPPTGASQINALLVGGGGASVFGYAGGGGEVKVIEVVDLTSPITIRVGAGGTDPNIHAGSTVLSQGASTFTAMGGSGGNADNPGQSGSGYAGMLDDTLYESGGGASASPTDPNGGPGLRAGDALNPTSLFAGDSECFGGGGASGYWLTDGTTGQNFMGTATCGGGYPIGSMDNESVVNPIPNSGGGAGTFSNIDVTNGASGIAVIRFLAPVVNQDPVASPTASSDGLTSASPSAGDPSISMISNSQNPPANPTPEFSQGLTVPAPVVTEDPLPSLKPLAPMPKETLLAPTVVLATQTPSPSAPASSTPIALPPSSTQSALPARSQLHTKVYFNYESSTFTIDSPEIINSVFAQIRGGSDVQIQVQGWIAGDITQPALVKLALTRAYAAEGALIALGVNGQYTILPPESEPAGTTKHRYATLNISWRE